MINRINRIFHFINPQGKGLEVGPSHNPIAPKSKGFDVEIVDHASAEELRLKYSNHGIDLNLIEGVGIFLVSPMHPNGSSCCILAQKGDGKN